MYHIRGGGGRGAVDIVGCSRVYHRRVGVVVGHRQDSIVRLRLKRKNTYRHFLVTPESLDYALVSYIYRFKVAKICLQHSFSTTITSGGAAQVRNFANRQAVF